MTRDELLALHREMESEGDRSPSGRFVIPALEDTIDIELLALQRLLDVTRFKRLMSITPQEFGQITPVEQRLLLRAAAGFQKRFDEICAWMGRNVRPDVDVPQFLRTSASN